MGIQSLLKFLNNASRTAHISEFENEYVAIDSYCWLHKGIYCCSVELAMGKPTTKYVTYCMRYIDMLLHFKVKPILVFDGRALSSKAETEKKRREDRQKKYKKGIELIRAGQTAEGRRLLGESVEVTHDLVVNLMKACRELNVDCIVAPFEADAQLAFFSLRNIVKCVITEDSDLLAYGCERVMFKMNTTGVGELIEKNQLHLSLGVDPSNFSEDKFRYMCILSGCDYLPSLTSIGPANALKFIKMLDDKDIYETLPRLPIYLNKPKIVVTQEYRDGFKIADNTFKHQLVYDPFQRKQVPLRPVSSEDDIVGEKLPEDLAFQLAIGNIDPNTMQKVDTFDPDTELTGFDILWKTDGVAKPVQRKPVSTIKHSLTDSKKRQREVSSNSNDFKKARIPYNLLTFKNLSLKETVKKVPETGFIFEPKAIGVKKNSSKVKNTSRSQTLRSRYFLLDKLNKSKTREQDKKEVIEKRKNESYEDYLRRLYDEYFPQDENESKGMMTKEGKEFCCDENAEGENLFCDSCTECLKCSQCNGSNETSPDTRKLNNCVKEPKGLDKNQKESCANHFLLDELYKESNSEVINAKPKLNLLKEKEPILFEIDETQNQEISFCEKSDLNISKNSSSFDDSTCLEREEFFALSQINDENKEDISTEEFLLDEKFERSPSPVFRLNKGSKISLNSYKSENNCDTTATPTSVYFSSPGSEDLNTTAPLKSIVQTPSGSNKRTASTKGSSKSVPAKSRLQNPSKSSTVNRTLFQFGFKKERKSETEEKT